MTRSANHHAATHLCPGCGRPGIPNRIYACRECWFRLPRDLQREISRTAYGRVTQTERLAALSAAAEFYAAEQGPPSSTDTCRSCHAPVLWRRTIAGKAMPIDPDPRPDGNCDLDDDGYTVHVLGGAQPTLDARPLYVSHFATCPHAKQHRSGR